MEMISRDVGDHFGRAIFASGVQGPTAAPAQVKWRVHLKIITVFERKGTQTHFVEVYRPYKKVTLVCLPFLAPHPDLLNVWSSGEAVVKL
jgi:hypothetical protein